MSTKFQKAVDIVNALPKDGAIQTTNDEKLKFYSLYKQATAGNVDTERPGMFEFTAKAKWDAWHAIKDKPKDEAKAEYVDALKDILKKNGSGDAEKFIKQIDEAAKHLAKRIPPFISAETSAAYGHVEQLRYDFHVAK
ncbi:hypothetical protein FRB96_007905 [Tulasnella sp. 330]|nr:hypothetical protein FRB96_007905 [Tulasnella sp. 330]